MFIYLFNIDWIYALGSVKESNILINISNLTHVFYLKVNTQLYACFFFVRFP